MPHIIRYTPPSKYDIEPFGSVCRVMESEKLMDLYIQTSKDVQTPIWMPIGAFLEMVFEKEIQQEVFIKECLSKIA
jgi:hypothetical protein